MLRWLGPGLLFAGAAVGVSHLVQATRAGALYGLGLLVVVLLANMMKYPAFAFGPHYAAATGRSLLDGYRRQGTWALVVFALVVMGTMLPVTSAVTLVTVTLLKATLPSALGSASPLTLAMVLFLVCALLLAVGRYSVLDRVMMVVVAILTVSTLAATVLVLPRVDGATFSLFPSGAMSRGALLFVAPLVGWMPSALDIAVWHSLWTLAKRRDTGHAPTIREASLDFNIGYVGAALLAVCFVLLGAGVAFGNGGEIPQGMAFGNFVLEMYVATLGEWSRVVIGGCAVMVMFSTTLAVLDGFPRTMVCLFLRFRSDEPEGGDVEQRKYYGVALAVVILGSMIVLSEFMAKFTALVDFATTLSFVLAPVLAVLNHRAVFAAHLSEGRPPRRMYVWSWMAIVVLSSFAIGYLYLRFAH